MSALCKVDSAIAETMKDTKYLECMATSIEFLQSHAWDLNTPNDSYHKTMFLEKLEEQKQRTRIMISKMEVCTGKLQNLQNSISTASAFTDPMRTTRTELIGIAKSVETNNDRLVDLSNQTKASLKVAKVLTFAMAPGIFWNIATSTYLPLWTAIRRRPYATHVILTIMAGAGLFAFQQHIYRGAESMKSWIFTKFRSSASQNIPVETVPSPEEPVADDDDDTNRALRELLLRFQQAADSGSRE